MASVHTVLGPRPAGELGQVLMHEHLLFELPGWQDNPLQSWDRQASLAHSVDRLTEAKAVGLGTFVDLTAIGVCRDIDFMRVVSERTGVAVVACTGWWLVAGVTSYFAQMEPADLSRIMVHELTKGIGDTGVRAGIIKVATGENRIDPVEEKVLRAAARAQAETGCCISTHTSRSTLGNEQIAIFRENGVDLARVVIGHSDDRDDLDYLRSLLDAGVTVQFDHIGSGIGITDQKKADLLATLVGDGHSDRLTLSHDTVGDLPGRPASQKDPFLRRRPSYLFTTFLPLLTERGVSDDAIQRMLVNNPARLLPF